MVATTDCFGLSNLVFRIGWLFREILSCSFVCKITFTQAKQISLIYFIIIIVSGVRLNPLGTAATTGLLYQPQMMVIVEKLVK
jgi:hypothetical protein